MITLRPFEERDRPAVLALRVSEEQSAFVDPLAETLASAEALQRDSFVIEAGGAVIGFFQIDSLSERRKIPGSLELHEVSIDGEQQGKGYGRAFVSALKPFLRRRYPDWATVCLTVNCRNLKAYRLYQLGGFADTGDLHREGRSGPQHVMRCSLSGE